MINLSTETLKDLYGWVEVRDGHSMSESHPFYVEDIFGGVMLVWENNEVPYGNVSSLYRALRNWGLISQADFMEFSNE